MKDVWNLDRIYRGFDDPAFAADMDTLRALVKQYNAFAEGLESMEALAGLRQGIELEEKLMQLFMKLISYAQLRQSVSTRDSECGSRLGQVMQLLSAIAGAEATWKAWAAKQEGLMDIVAGDELLKEYTFRFENLRKESVHLLGSLGEEIAARLELSGGSAWSEMQGYLTSTVEHQQEVQLRC